jgi:hypothetical protein
MELPGIHDGVLVWSHSCGHAWPRFPAPGPLHDAAVAFLAGQDPWELPTEGQG